ncbi:MAG TPA: ferritin family protein [Thermodesulfobacteriota bacterium]|nr:ferritin family protein [Thermodesulfobacteriota bacterium]
MSLDFNADEILEMAQQIERNGFHFYRQAAKGVKNPGSAELLLNLAAMEEVHEKIFTRMRAELTEAEKKKKIFDPDDENTSYLKAWADVHVFNVQADPAEKLTGKEKVEDILRMAIGLEKDSIVFYLGMKEMVPERLGGSRIDGIIREEMRHVNDLSREFETLRHQQL